MKEIQQLLQHIQELRHLRASRFSYSTTTENNQFQANMGIRYIAYYYSDTDSYYIYLVILKKIDRLDLIIQKYVTAESGSYEENPS